MGQLKALKIPRETVQIPGGGSIAVRGLSLRDILFLVHAHSGAMEELFKRFGGRAQGEMSPDELTEAGGQLIEAAPVVAASIIALASDDPEEVEIASQIPFPSQVEALEKIAMLTFAAEGGPKKVVETVLKMFRGTSKLLGNLRP